MIFSEAITNFRIKRYSNIFLLSLKRFYSEKRVLWATSLTFTTIFSLIPLLSVLFFLFNIFGDLTGLKSFIQPYIYKTLAPGAQQKVLSTIDSLVNNIDFGTIGALGSTVLIISVFLLLFEIEYSLNDIWLIKNKMSIISRAAIYWAAITIGPLLLASSMFIIATLQHYKAVKIIGAYVSLDISPWLSYLLICVAFTVLYFFMPGAKVKLRSAVFGGIVAGTLWKISGLCFTLYTSNFFFYYPKVYGSLAAIPMFLLWLFLCWILFLLGAEMTYLHQNYSFYTNSHKPLELNNNNNRECLTLTILFYVSNKFLYGDHLPSLSTISSGLKIPFHLVHELTEPLLKHGILIESTGRQTCFAPGRPLSKIVLSDVLDKIHHETMLSENFYDYIEDNTCASILKTLHADDGIMKHKKTIEELLTEHNKVKPISARKEIVS